MSSHRLSPEQTKLGQIAFKRNRKWYKETLLAIFKGEIQCTATQLQALKTFADQQGWVGPKRKVNVVAEKSRYKPKPQLSEDLVARLTIAQANPALQIIAAQAKEQASVNADFRGSLPADA